MKYLVALGAAVAILFIGIVVIGFFGIEDAAASVGAVLGAGVVAAAVLILWPRSVE